MREEKVAKVKAKLAKVFSKTRYDDLGCGIEQNYTPSKKRERRCSYIAWYCSAFTVHRLVAALLPPAPPLARENKSRTS